MGKFGGKSGQALIEFLLLTAIFMLLLAGVAQKLPVTVNSATPILGGQVEARLQTGVGFSQVSNARTWTAPEKAGGKGGMHDM